jgi:hypothetical protein
MGISRKGLAAASSNLPAGFQFGGISDDRGAPIVAVQRLSSIARKRSLIQVGPAHLTRQKLPVDRRLNFDPPANAIAKFRYTQQTGV